MTETQIKFVKDCIQTNDMHRFYTWSSWLNVRTKVLDIDKNECQDCKERGLYTKATTVHHVNHVRKYPELALEIFYSKSGQQERNLVSLCHECHEKRHGRLYDNISALTPERW